MKTNFNELVNELAEILRGHATHTQYDSQGCRFRLRQDAPARDWHNREQMKYPLHPAIVKALESDHRPTDWHLLTLEWPHVSETDSTRLAYTRDDRAGEADRQVITTVGKYLTRHFTTMPDHEIRNLVALYAAGESCKFVHTMAEMLHHLHRGPTSCMVSRREIRCDDGELRHPYQAYDPKYGWHMAVRTENDDTVGRALCVDKYFVRSYKKTGGHSYSDERLEAWLVAQGYTHLHQYPCGTELAYYGTSNEFLAPFIDGDEKRVSVGGVKLVIDEDGDYVCNNTDGTPEGGEERESCSDCGYSFDAGDGYWVGIYEDSQVCSDCHDNNYTYAYSRRGYQYYISSDNTIAVGGDYYDVDYLHDNEIVELIDGEYASMGDCVLINDDWYLSDDDEVCYAEDIEDYALKDDCWQCDGSNNWYTNETAALMDADGNRYHADHAPEQETEKE